MQRRVAVCAAVLGATLMATPDAFAKGRRGGKRRGEPIELVRPEDGADADAAGNVRIEKVRGGDQTVIQLSHLEARTRYEVRDADSGETLGDVKTNRKGRATFNLTRSLRKAAKADGSESGDPGEVSNVEVIDPETGDCVLEGGVEADPCEGLASGFADYTNEAGDSASIYMQSAPGFDSESFSLTFFPVQESFAAAFYDFYRDTANGDELPLGVASVSELAGRGFQIVSPEGAVILEDTLPQLEAQDCYGFDDKFDIDWSQDWSGDWQDDWTGDWKGDENGILPGEWDGVFDWDLGDGGSKDPAGDPSANGFLPGTRSVPKSGRKGGAKEEPVSGYTLRIEDENGDLQDAGLLVQELYDQPIDCPWLDGDTGHFGGGIVIGIIVLPIDGSFDWEGLLDKLLAGLEQDSSDFSGDDWGGFDFGDFFSGFGDDTEPAVKNGRR